ncbi:histidine--tRNA ligase [candidate division GN15 bacterium]|uniref:Histidine--tRNA ligase n=1 Tax=candidate division GN15 bacterium TaxID=2072418 RepID=A0A855X4T3_9BACT|nr:MAG: histidine--tRNA ligase [candidate division GN15 bacterium]
MGKEKVQRVRPQLLKGFRDYSPSEQIAREAMLGKVRSAVELMGFLPLQTASLEFAETLLGPHYSSDSLAELFGFTGPDDINMALRYEFTVSLARYVASQPDLALPFRRYQYGNVWRVDKPGPGRFREFMQFDIDIVGTQNLLADAEIIAAMVTIFEHLGVRRFAVRYSSRKLLNGVVEWAGIAPERGPEVMRVIDKLEKQGKDAVLLELGPGREDKSGDKIPGLNLGRTEIAKLEEFLTLAGTQDSDPLAHAQALVGKVEAARVGIEELREIERHLRGMSIEPSEARIDLTIVRGLGYYTGAVFETTLLDLPEFGSVFSGGRYDNLVERFINKPCPGVGSSIGIDRLLAALIELKAVELTTSTSQVIVTTMDRERIGDYLNILHELRQVGIRAEIYSGDTRNLTKQIKYADKVGIPFAVIAGSDEFEAGRVTVKNLVAGRVKGSETADRETWLAAEGIQETIPRSQLIQYLRSRLG